jgi:UDP-N-acetylglucosamine transferase subunit ALG13
MIFVTVGSMMAFDRLICAMDHWAKEHPYQDLLAQIGGGSYVPNHMRWTRMMSPVKFKEAVRDATIMVAHAGMGSYFVAMEMRKPVVLLPRHASAREHTTEHQLHTIEWLRHKPGVFAAKSEDELASAIDKALVSGSTAMKDFCRFAPEPFLLKVRQFLLE